MALHFPSPGAESGRQAPPDEPYAGPGAGPPKRKRVTQRLVLGAKAGHSQEGDSHTGRIRLPGASEPRADLPIQGEIQGDIQVPVYELLQCIPAEFLTSDHETLFSSEDAQREAPLPLKVILPSLPSGKVEIPIGLLSGCLPQGMVKSDEELGEYSMSPIKIPLPMVIPRIPEEVLVLRYDQKPIDQTVRDLDDPFSLEALQAAAQEAGQAAEYEEAMAAGPESEGPVDALPQVPDLAVPDFPAVDAADDKAVDGQEIPAGYIDPGMDPTVPMESDEEGMPEAGLGAENLPTVSMVEPTADEPDLSFTKTEAFRQFLQENEAEGLESPMEPPARPEPWAPSEPELAVTEIIESADQPDAEAAPDFPPVLDAPAKEKETVPMHQPRLPAPEAAPSAIIPPLPAFKPVHPVNTAPPEAPPKFHFKAPGAPVAPTPPPEPKPSFKMPSLGKPPAATPPASGYDVGRDPSISKTSKMGSPAAQAVVEISSSLRHSLRLAGVAPVTLRDIVHQINCWPGMEGCILGGKDGLTITSEIEDERFGNSLSAFAPKILSRLNELFKDLGFDEVEEIQTPMQKGCVFIFRYQELFFIALSGESMMPVSYRQLIKEIIIELANQKTK